jgi:hypothetical protein
MESIKKLLHSQRKEIEDIIEIHQEDINRHFNTLLGELSKLKEQNDAKDLEISKLNNSISDNKFNQDNYKNFSMVSNLSKQITEKELEIKKLQSQLRSAKKEIDGLKDKIDTLSEKGCDFEDSKSDTHSDFNNDHQEQPSESHVQLSIQEPEPVKEPEPIQQEPVKEPVQESAKEHENVQEQETVKQEPEPEQESIGEEDKDTEEEEEESDISYVRKKINGKYYFVSDETPSQIYEYIGDNEVGEIAIGKMNGKKAVFY